MALCMGDVFINLAQHEAMLDDLGVLADRIARNWEIAGLHYPSEFEGRRRPRGPNSAPADTNSWYSKALAAARQEWDPNYAGNQYP